MPEIWVGRTTLNGEKEEDGHTMFNLPYLLPCDDQNYPFEFTKKRDYCICAIFISIERLLRQRHQIL